MEVVFWVIVAIVVLAVVYACALSFRKRKEALGREPFMSDVRARYKRARNRFAGATKNL